MSNYAFPKEEAVAHNVLTGIISHTLFVLDKQTPDDKATNYKPLYYGLFNGITTIIRDATTYEQAMDALKQLQCEAEDAYIGHAD